MFRSKNRFNVQIAFESGAAVGLRSDSGVALTPQDVVDELKWFIQRAETLIKARREKESR